MSLWKRQKGEDKIIGQGATPSPCKQGWDSSRCLESKPSICFFWAPSSSDTGTRTPPMQLSNCPGQQTAMQSWFTHHVLSPSLGDNVGQGQEMGLWAWMLFCQLSPPHTLLTSSSLIYASPFLSSSFSPERRLPVRHCNPITYLTEECVISTE